MKKDSALGWLLVSVQILVFVVFVLLPWREPSALSLVTGGLMVIAAIVFLVWAFTSLGKALTANPVPLEDATLRTSGPFALVRHPIYSGLLLGLLGLTIIMGSWWTMTWWFISLLFFWGKSRWEDTLLRSKYEDAWIAWSATTPALVPAIHSRKRSAP
jgi:protein-S-isoprenylcysteine O-methyltransferase Ste14